ncbi:hypothetical protein CRENBAI_014375 [Crenichthys baileyi]|uniref:Uncharacterized protein n=1 Tax=Crenichthys baileyi TaxID=28760 RepID=A0AAV9RY14_9TELE
MRSSKEKRVATGERGRADRQVNERTSERNPAAGKRRATRESAADPFDISLKSAATLYAPPEWCPLTCSCGASAAIQP